MAKNRGDIVTAREWQNISNTIYNLAEEKKLEIGEGQIFEQDELITPAKINILQEAINKLEGAFNNNCCQSTCQSQCRCETYWLMNCNCSDCSCGCASSK